MSAKDRPEWLPKGWTMEVRTRRTGVKDRYYTCPVSGSTFRSKVEVMRYLNIEKVDGLAAESAPCDGDNMQLLAAQVDNPLEWLPTGWILEIRTRMNGVSAGNNYKCYFDPSTGSRFYSKEEVVQYLKAHKRCSPTSDQRSGVNTNPTDFCSSSYQKKSINTNSTDNVRAEIDYSPSGLPHGWIKVIKARKANSNYRVKKDPYYIDPVSGYAFRSKKDVFRYIETGEVRRCTFRLKKRHTQDACSLKKESLPPTAAGRLKVKRTAVRRRLFSRQTPMANVRMVTEIADPPQNPPSPPLGHVSAQSGEGGSATSCLILSNVEHLGQGNGKFQSESQANPAFDVERIPGQLAIKMLPGSVSEKPSELLMHMEGEKLPVPDASPSEEKKLELTKKQGRPKRRRRGRPPGSGKAKAFKSVTDQPGPSKTKAIKAITMPLRASKRLAGLKANPVVDFGIGDRSRRAKARWYDEPRPTMAKDSNPSCGLHQKATPLIDLELQENLESKEPLAEQAAQGEQVDPPTMPPFGDSWPDPCIEFAFKTLTGDIPVLEDTAAIQDYFNQQLTSTQSPSPSGGLASLGFGGPLASSRDDGRPCSLENGKVNKECHQKTGLNH